MNRALPLLLTVLLACDPVPVEPEPSTPEWPARGTGTLQAGAANGALDLPVGLPLGGFTARDETLGEQRFPDDRDSDYVTDFIPSGGWQTRIPAQAVWLENGDATAIIIRLDLIYSFDGLTEAIGQKLSDLTGEDLTDSVFTVTNHSHSSYGTFSRATMLFFGTDFFREETLDRMVDQAVALAMEAREGRTDAAIGLGVMPDFDPVEDGSIFRDRRDDNDDLPRPDGVISGAGWKDERATMLRVDSTDGEPIAALFAFGIHGTVMGESNFLLTSDAPGHIATLMNERHPGPVWMFAQGAGGDSSPGGRFGGFARMEWIAEAAAPRLLALYDAIELTSNPIGLEPVQRYIEQGRGIKVTRNGTRTLEYLPWDEEWAEDPYEPDEQVWSEEGCLEEWHEGCEVLSPIDEFWPQYGAALCGEPDVDLSILGLDIDLPMYASCLDINKAFALFRIAFQEYVPDRSAYPLPLPESRTTMLGAIGLQGIPITYTDDSTRVDDVVLSFAPGEVTTLWAQFLRHRAQAWKGVDEVVSLGYSMDHEGYLLTVEDWLQAGYESTITWWGPLQGEYILEQMLEVIAVADSDVVEDPSWPDFPTETWYPDWDTPFVEPDATPEAGETADPLPDYLLTWDGTMPAMAEPAAQIPRVQGLATWTFWGSDPATGLIGIVLEAEQEDGSWLPVQTPGGVVRDALPDMLVTYTPFPLFGLGEDPLRDHLYHVQWQAVLTAAGLDGVAALPLGNYRLHASGLSRDPADTDYPYATLPWDSTSQPFEVVPAAVSVEATVGAGELSARAAYAAVPTGFRLLHLVSNPQTSTPLVPAGAATARAVNEDDGAEVTLSVTSTSDDELGTTLTLDSSGLSAGAWTLWIDDGNGNVGSASLTIP